MPLNLEITSKVQGAEGVYHAKGTLVVEGTESDAKVLVKDLGEGRAELFVDDEIKTSVLNKKAVKSYKGATTAQYEGEALKKGVELSFSQFSFVSKTEGGAE